MTTADCIHSALSATEVGILYADTWDVYTSHWSVNYLEEWL